MVHKKHYLPNTLTGRVTWLNTFASALLANATTLGILVGETTLISKFAAYYAYMVGLSDNTVDFGKQLTAFIKILSFAPQGTLLGAAPVFTPGTAPPVAQAGIFTYIALLVQRIKANPAYTESIGQALGIIGDGGLFVPDDFVAHVKAEAKPGFVDLSFVKGETEGYNFYARLRGQSVWTFLAHSTHSPYHDTRPLANAATPENREYYGRGELNDAEIGHNSDIVSVTFAG
jgi:hypothetical protein